MFFFQFLNAFWNAGVKHESEKIWEIAAQVPLSLLSHSHTSTLYSCHFLIYSYPQFNKLGKGGNDLDEFFSHKFLEDSGGVGIFVYFP